MITNSSVPSHADGYRRFQRVGLALGPALFAVVLLLPTPTDLTPQAQHLVALIAFMAAWWITEAVSFAATSLVPLVLPAVMGLMKPEAAAAPYADPNVFLPVLAAPAKALDIHPYLLMLSATLAASCGFMLPVATPPNAVAFASAMSRRRKRFGLGWWSMY
jgi:di/tricarboxylate transporter